MAEESTSLIGSEKEVSKHGSVGKGTYLRQKFSHQNSIPVAQIKAKEKANSTELYRDLHKYTMAHMLMHIHHACTHIK